MKVKDLLTMDVEIDVYDDVCEELAICFCAPQELTEEGMKHFAEVLEYEIDIDTFNDCAVVHIDGNDGNGWKKRLRKAEEFFYSAAGYCADSDYQKWFKEEELTTFYLDCGNGNYTYGEWKDREAAEFFAKSAGMKVIGTDCPASVKEA